MPQQIISNLSALIGIISMIITLAVAAVAGRAMTKSTIDKNANDAQQRAISAMQAELLTLRNKIDDLKRENTRLEYIIDTICAALKKRGLVISIEGEMVSIEEPGGKSTITTRIRGQIHNNSEQGE